jgi:ribonuclease-3
VNLVLDGLQYQLGYIFSEQDLLLQALTHCSFSSSNNERLEFLGDAVLDLLIGEWLYQRFPLATEGELSHMRAQAVCGNNLAAVGFSLGLGDCMRMGAGEIQSGGRTRHSTVANAVEAIIAAIYLDGGMTACRQVVNKLFVDVALKLDPQTRKDPKTRVQEFLQARTLSLPQYRLLKRSGQDHAAIFHVECAVVDLDLRADAEASSRKKAEQLAAEKILLLLEST